MQTYMQPNQKNYWTALIIASCGGHVEVVRALLAAGAGVEAANDSGWTPLLFASYRGRVDVVRALLDAGASVNVMTSSMTALMWASSSGHVDVVRALLAAGANKHLIGIQGHTAHSLASGTPAWTAAIRALLDLAP